MQVAGVTYRINWGKFRRGYSIFIPCLDCHLAKKEVLQVTKRLKVKVLIKHVIEGSVQGLRIWRL